MKEKEGWGVERERGMKAHCHYYRDGKCLHKGIRRYDPSFELVEEDSTRLWIDEFNVPKCGICRRILKKEAKQRKGK